jgi:outer membrane protein assembly factor BamD
MTKFRLILALLLAGILAPAVSDAAIIYRSDEGWSIEGDEGSTLEKTAADQMHKAEQLEHEGKNEAATKAYQNLVKHFSLSVLAPKAQQKIGNLLEKQSHYEGAFDAYHKYLTKYPKGDDFDAVVDSMFKIGKLFLDGAKRRVFGVPIASSMQKAQEMFENIVKDAPYSKVAPLAQFNTGLALEKQNDLPGAIAAYQKVVSDYGSDPIAEAPTTKTTLKRRARLSMNSSIAIRRAKKPPKLATTSLRSKPARPKTCSRSPSITTRPSSTKLRSSITTTSSRTSPALRTAITPSNGSIL